MSKKGMVSFWRYTEKTHRHIDRLQLVFADGEYNYDSNDHQSLLDIAKMAFRQDDMAEVRVSRDRFVTFVINMQERTFDLGGKLSDSIK